MNRPTDTGAERKKLERELLERMREVRSRIDPGVLVRARHSIEAQPGAEPLLEASGPQSLLIDRKKNLSVVMQALSLQNHSADFRTQLKKILGEHIGKN